MWGTATGCQRVARKPGSQASEMPMTKSHSGSISAQALP